MYRGWRLLTLVLVAALIAVPAVGVSNAPEAKAAPAPIEQDATLAAPPAVVQTVIVSDSNINRIIRWRMFGSWVRFLPGNQIECHWFGYAGTFNVGAEGGRGYMEPVGTNAANMLWMLSWGCTQYSSADQRVYLTRLPWFVDPRSIFGSAVTGLPTIMSITTLTGRANVTYSWP